MKPLNIEAFKNKVLKEGLEKSISRELYEARLCLLASTYESLETFSISIGQAHVHITNAEAIYEEWLKIVV